jgi:hypothetical protein
VELLECQKNKKKGGEFAVKKYCFIFAALMMFFVIVVGIIFQ